MLILFPFQGCAFLWVLRSESAPSASQQVLGSAPPAVIDRHMPSVMRELVGRDDLQLAQSRSSTTQLDQLGPRGSSRDSLNYYKVLWFAALQYAMHAQTALEVGCSYDPFLNHLSWIPDRTCVQPYQATYEAGENREQHAHNGVKNITADFETWDTQGKTWDIIICSQVLEHLNRPSPFARKLLEVGDVAIISVPYLWHDERFTTARHKSHHITMEKVLEWVHPAKPSLTTIVTEYKEGEGHFSPLQRLVMVFERHKNLRPPTSSSTG